jgi:GNAT superfamily N-acetyltransferase
VQFDFLVNHQEAMPTIGRWYFDRWDHRVPGRTVEYSISRLDHYLNADRIPFMLVAIEAGDIVATAQLKYREMEDLFPEKEHWLGGVYVAPESRGRGVGSRIADEIALRAPSYGVQTLHLQTEQLDGGIYARLGWTPAERAETRGFPVVVMERPVRQSAPGFIPLKLDLKK